MTAPTPQTPPHQSTPLSARQAAAALGVNEKTIRRWIERGELVATKNASGSYRINAADLYRHRTGQAAPVEPHPAAPAADSAADMAAPSMPQAAPSAAPVDLAPLADLIERQTGEIRRLSESATMWQIRAMQAEEKLRQLTAGSVEPKPRAEAQEASPQAQGEEIAVNRDASTSQSAPVVESVKWWEFWRR